MGTRGCVVATRRAAPRWRTAALLRVLLATTTPASATSRPPRGDAAPWSHVPVAIADGPRAPSPGATRFNMCALDWVAYAEAPHRFPSLAHLAAASGDCATRPRTMTFAQLYEEYFTRDCAEALASAEPAPAGCEPAGLLFTQTPDGDGTASRMVAASGSALTFVHSGLEASLLELAMSMRGEGDTDVAALALRVLAAAFGRPAWGAAVASAAGADAAAAPHHVFIAPGPVAPTLLRTFTAAFPRTPWAFVYEDPGAALAAAMAPARPPPGAPAAAPRKVALDAPCIRQGGVLVDSLLARLLVGMSPSDVAGAMHAALAAGRAAAPPPPPPELATPAAVRALLSDVTPEAACAAGLADGLMTVLGLAAAARRDGLAAVASDGGDSGGGQEAVGGGGRGEAAVAAALRGGGEYDGARIGSLFSSKDTADSGSAEAGVGDLRRWSGVVGGVGQAVLLASNGSSAKATLRVLRSHFAPPAAPWMPTARMAAVRRAGSSAGIAVAADGATAAIAAAAAQPAWPALAAATAKYLAPIAGALRNFNVRSGRAAAAAVAQPEPPPRAAPAPLSDAAPFDVRLLPLGGGYPALYALGDILGAWNPDVTTIPAHVGRFSSLRLFNGSDDADMAEAELYRRSEVPFVVRAPRGLRAASAAWRDPAYLVASKDASPNLQVEVNTASRHFMYYSRDAAAGGGGAGGGGGGSSGGWDDGAAARAPAPTDGRMSMAEWVRSAALAAAADEAEEAAAVQAGEIDAAWAAPAAYQSRAAPAAPPPRPLSAFPTGGVRLPPGGRASLSPSAASAPPRFPLGRELAEWDAEGFGDSAAAAVKRRGGPPPPPPPPSRRITRRTNRTLYYAHVEPGDESPEAWILRDLPLFDAAAPPYTGALAPPPPPPGYPAPRRPPSPSSLFVVDARDQRGVQCRFGQRGIMAEAHFDAVRNFIAVVTGRKRYILAPPQACAHLRLLTSGPARRHSAADWTAPEGVAAVGGALALEVVLEAGDVLYVPAFWMHQIVNLDTNAQCNTRSGTPASPAIDALLRCGFDMRDTPTEAPGDFADVDAVPLHHALALALDGIDVRRASVVPFAVTRELFDALRLMREAATRGAAAASRDDSKGPTQA